MTAMEEMLSAIYELTVQMNEHLQAGNQEEFDNLLNAREAMMKQGDALRESDPHFRYSQEEKKLLEKTFSVNQGMARHLQQNMAETEASLKKIEQQKKVSAKFHPYFKPSNGIFIDEKK